MVYLRISRLALSGSYSKVIENDPVARQSRRGIFLPAHILVIISGYLESIEYAGFEDRQSSPVWEEDINDCASIPVVVSGEQPPALEYDQPQANKKGCMENV